MTRFNPLFYRDFRPFYPPETFTGLRDDLANQNEMTTIKCQVGSGEVTHLADQSTDVILMGSSLHWMDGHQTNAEVRRILRPNGILWIFEYQFPKAPALPELNE